jgi:hypothetical protein
MMDSRELIKKALDAALDLAIADAEHVHAAYRGYKPEKHKTADDDVELIKKSDASTCATGRADCGTSCECDD